MTLNVCQLGDCDRKHYAQGYCRPHYDVERHAGRLKMRPKRTEVEGFWAKIEKTEGCWIWHGKRNRWGYGDFPITRDRKEINSRAHRYAFELLRYQIPEGLVLDHLCKNPPCVNPDHLEPVTIWENVRRSDNFTALNMRKTQCPRGHPYDDANTYMNAGSRICRTCQALHQRNYYRRKHGLLDAIE